MKQCPTRWLSLLKCVDRYLRQYDGPKLYFLFCEEAETVKVRSIISRLENPMTKALLLFLSFVLLSVDRFNRHFHKSTENTTSQLYNQMNTLVRLYAPNFLTSDTILAANDNLRFLEFAEENQISNKDLDIGSDTWVSIAEL